MRKNTRTIKPFALFWRALPPDLQRLFPSISTPHHLKRACMIDITLENFETEVITASMSVPVLVDFWAPWCGPCQSLGPVLEQLEVAYAGRFKLAKIDSDQVPQLSQAFGVRSIPSCFLLINGQPVDAFQGAQSATQIRAFLDKHLPPAENAELAAEVDESAEAALAAGDVEAALAKLQQNLASEPDSQDARFNYIKLLLQLGRMDDATVAFAPVIAQTSSVRRFDSLQRWINALNTYPEFTDWSATQAALHTRIGANKRDFDARFSLSQTFMAQQHWTQALDELLEILMRDRAWNEDLARKTYIAMLDIMEPAKAKVADGQIPPDDPVVATYRRRLSSVILS